MSAKRTAGKGTANSVAGVLGSFGLDMAIEVCACMIANHPLPAAYGSKPVGSTTMGCTILCRRDARLVRSSRACGHLCDSFKLARVNPQKRRAIFERLRSANPNPTTELEYSTPFELLVAVVLSAQATDKSVNLATRKLFAVANTPKAMLALGQEGLEHYIKTIGLYRTKAKNLLATCRILMECHGGEVPRSREALQTLPGVGRKTANVVLNTAFGESTIAVDTHIFRVANRTGLAPGVDVLEVERRLEKFTPDEFKRNAHHWLILHGRYVCVARRPKCPECIIRELCEYRAKTVAQPASHAA